MDASFSEKRLEGTSPTLSPLLCPGAEEFVVVILKMLAGQETCFPPCPGVMHFHMFPPYAVSIVLWHVCRLWVRQDSVCPALIAQTGGLAGGGGWLPFYIPAWTASALELGSVRIIS